MLEVAAWTGMILFCVGAIFWAGASYNQLKDMRLSLHRIDQTLSNYKVMEDHVTRHDREIRGCREDTEKRAAEIWRAINELRKA